MPSMADWTTNDIPDQTGRRAVVTGPNSGVGYETALALAGAGAEVILAGRSEPKGRDALTRIKAVHPRANVRFERLDLASLASVAACADRLTAVGAPIDLLVNNAGVMGLPRRQVTEDGFERQFQTNHLGHFALTGRLLPLLRRGRSPRVVSLSSLAARRAAIDFDDLQGERTYGPYRAYQQSKLATLMFAIELQRRSDANGWGLLSDAAHPGWAMTNIFANGPGARGNKLAKWVAGLVSPVLGQSGAAGALPVLYAATAPDAKPAGYYGPTGFIELKGPPGVAKVPAQANDRGVAARLWEVSEQLTGVTFGTL